MTRMFAALIAFAIGSAAAAAEPLHVYGPGGPAPAIKEAAKAYDRQTGRARDMWIKDPSLDAWIIWNIWQVANPKLADAVPVEPQYRIYRDTGVVLTTNGKADPDAEKFAAFLESREGARIFQRHGWVVPK